MPKYWQKYDVDMLQIQSSQRLCCCLSATLPLKPISMSMGRAAAAWNHGDVRGPCGHRGPGLYEWPFQPPDVHSIHCLLPRDMPGPMIPLKLGVILMSCSVLPPETMLAEIGETCWLQWPYEGGSSMLLPETMWISMIHATTDYKGK